MSKYVNFSNQARRHLNSTQFCPNTVTSGSKSNAQQHSGYFCLFLVGIDYTKYEDNAMLQGLSFR